MLLLLMLLPLLFCCPRSRACVSQKVFYRKGKQAGDIYTHYMDTYLCQYGSVLPPHYLNRREDGTVEKVPIPLTDPQMFEPPLRGAMVSFFFVFW